ncbi:hypothetical protein ACN47E_009866 [Coniothyrium glycines]
MSPPSPPYAPMFWPLGGPPVKRIDIPAQTVFMFFFLVGGGIHMKFFRGNRSEGHKFLPNLFIFLFCMSRVVTSILRLASVSHPQSVQLALAAQIFVAAGVIILFIINLILSMRLVRSTHRSIGWHPAFSMLFKLLFVLIGFTIVSLIVTTVQSFYTLDVHIRAIDRSFQLYGSTFLAIIATLPIPIALLACIIPYSPLDEFGTGRFRTKVIVLLVSSFLLSVGAWYRCGVTWQTPVPRSQPLPGYLAKGPFYIFNFLVEIQTVIMYAVLRVDQRWHIPNGAHGSGSYSRRTPFDVEMQNSRPTSATTITKAVSLKSTTISLSVDKSSLDEKRFEADLDTEVLLCSPCRRLEHVATVQSSLTVPDVTLSRPPSQRASIISNRLTHLFSRSLGNPATPDQKRNWRASEEARIVRRLGGPWERLPSPTTSTYSKHSSMRDNTTADYYGDSNNDDDDGRSFSSILPTPRSAFISPSQRTSAAPPRIEDVVDEINWNPKIDWEFKSPQRFLSLKKRSMIGLK